MRLMHNVKIILSKALVVSFMRNRIFMNLLIVNVLAVLVDSLIFTDVVLLVMLMVARQKNSILVVIDHC